MKNANHLKNKGIPFFTKEEGLVLGVNAGRPTVIDLFAGCGGLSLGLYQAGWEGLFAIEKNAFAFVTLTTGDKIEVPRYTPIGNAIPPLFAEQAEIMAKFFLQQPSMNRYQE